MVVCLFRSKKRFNPTIVGCLTVLRFISRIPRFVSNPKENDSYLNNSSKSKDSGVNLNDSILVSLNLIIQKIRQVSIATTKRLKLIPFCFSLSFSFSLSISISERLFSSQWSFLRIFMMLGKDLETNKKQVFDWTYGVQFNIIFFLIFLFFLHAYVLFHLHFFFINL